MRKPWIIIRSHPRAPVKVIPVWATSRRVFSSRPRKPVGGWILGAGPVGYYPTATESELGQGKLGVGPTVVALQQKDGFTYGILANHIWSVAGWGPQEVNATYLQPFVSYTTKTYTTLSLNTESHLRLAFPAMDRAGERRAPTISQDSAKMRSPSNWAIR